MLFKKHTERIGKIERDLYGYCGIKRTVEGLRSVMSDNKDREYVVSEFPIYYYTHVPINERVLELERKLKMLEEYLDVSVAVHPAKKGYEKNSSEED